MKNSYKKLKTDITEAQFKSFGISLEDVKSMQDKNSNLFGYVTTDISVNHNHNGGSFICNRTGLSFPAYLLQGFTQPLPEIETVKENEYAVTIKWCSIPSQVVVVKAINECMARMKAVELSGESQCELYDHISSTVTLLDSNILVPNYHYPSPLVLITNGDALDLVIKLKPEHKTSFQAAKYTEAQKELKRLVALNVITIDQVSEVIAKAKGEPVGANSNGNEIKRGFVGSYYEYWTEVQKYTTCKEPIRVYSNGYIACYYCDKSLQVFTYCEGDFITVSCESQEQLNIEVQSNLDFFRENY